MSGQRHLRLAALIIGALGATRLLWLVMDVVRLGPATGRAPGCLVVAGQRTPLP